MKQCLKGTLEDISSMDLVAWLEADKRRNQKMHSSLAKFLAIKVKKGAYDLKPRPKASRTKEMARSRNETLLQLIHERFGLAYALLILCSFNAKDIETWGLHILRCLGRTGYFYCGALEAKAAKINSSEPTFDGQIPTCQKAQA